MSIQYICKLCTEDSDKFICEDLAQLHVIITHPQRVGNCAILKRSPDHLLTHRQIHMPNMCNPILPRKLRSSAAAGREGCTGWNSGTLGQLLMGHGTPLHPIVYKRLSELLALVARISISQHAQRKNLSMESYTLVMVFSRFSIRCGNIARLLAESRGYRIRVVSMLRKFGYSSKDFSVSLQEDEDEILQLTKQLLKSSASTNLVLSISNNPCQAQALLDLFNELLTNSPSNTTSVDNQPEQRPSIPASTQHFNIFDRSKLRRLVIKLAVSSGQMPSSLYLADVKLDGRDSVSGGAFADIYRGKCDKQQVAIKRLRFFICQTEEKCISTSKRGFDMEIHGPSQSLTLSWHQ